MGDGPPHYAIGAAVVARGLTSQLGRHLNSVTGYIVTALSGPGEIHEGRYGVRFEGKGDFFVKSECLVAAKAGGGDAGALLRLRQKRWKESGQTNAACPICLGDPIFHPHTLTCGHRLCRECLKKLHLAGGSGKARCPLCMAPFDYRDQHVEGSDAVDTLVSQGLLTVSDGLVSMDPELRRYVRSESLRRHAAAGGGNGVYTGSTGPTPVERLKSCFEQSDPALKWTAKLMIDAVASSDARTSEYLRRAVIPSIIGNIDHVLWRAEAKRQWAAVRAGYGGGVNS